MPPSDLDEDPHTRRGDHRAWLMLAVGDDRQHGGNDGYDDDPDVHYSWDDTVANHAAVAVGDRIVLWDKHASLGASVIEAIEEWTDEKILRTCPQCGLSGIKPRKRLAPKFKCYKCKHEFPHANTRVATVKTYRSRHDAGWVTLDGALQGRELRSVCMSPKSQLSLRPLDWSAFQSLLTASGSTSRLAHLERRAAVASGGHQRTTVRVRIGQSAFRQRLLASQGAVCAFTGPAPQSVLEAGHLYSYAELAVHYDHGGLLLRRDIHRLFDDGDVAVDPVTLTVDVRTNVSKYEQYAGLQGGQLSVSLSVEQKNWLKRHWDEHRG